MGTQFCFRWVLGDNPLRPSDLPPNSNFATFGIAALPPPGEWWHPPVSYMDASETLPATTSKWNRQDISLWRGVIQGQRRQSQFPIEVNGEIYWDFGASFRGLPAPLPWVASPTRPDSLVGGGVLYLPSERRLPTPTHEGATEAQRKRQESGGLARRSQSNNRVRGDLREGAWRPAPPGKVPRRRQAPWRVCCSNMISKEKNPNHHHRGPPWIHRPREPWGESAARPLSLHGGCAAQT